MLASVKSSVPGCCGNHYLMPNRFSTNTFQCLPVDTCRYDQACKSRIRRSNKLTWPTCHVYLWSVTVLANILAPSCESTTEILWWCLVGLRSFPVRRHVVLARTHCSANVPTWRPYLPTYPDLRLSRQSKLTWSSARNIAMIATTTTPLSMPLHVVVAYL